MHFPRFASPACITGFEDVCLARLLDAQDATDGLTDEDAVPELPEIPGSQTGALGISATTGLAQEPLPA